MEDFIFGTFANDELKLAHHRLARRGLQHAHDLTSGDPEPDQPVTITVRVGPDLDADHVACYYALDGSEPLGARGVATHGQVMLLERGEAVWDSLAWGYLTVWRGTLPVRPEGAVVRYRIGAWAGDGPETFADWPEVKQATDLAAAAFFRGQSPPDVPPGDPATGHIFTFHVDRLEPPAWARRAVIYHVFVDRFHPGQGRKWLQTQNLHGFCGGTLWGVAEQMDYLADLGATCLWLSPTFASPTYHGYDITDYERVEPRLGGDEALRAVIQAAHARGIRVLLDLVCNHASNKHPIFQDARANPASRYRDWFTFDDSKTGYRAFFGAPSMPQVNLQHPAARDWMITIARYWLREFDVDGYRLDHANGPGPDFWSDFWAACKAEKPDCFCFGEVVEPPDVLRTYAGRLDGCLDFHLADAFRHTFARGRWTKADFERFLARHLAYFPDNFLRPTFLDNYDMDRFLYLAGDDKDALRRAAAVQMRLPGPPIIYYGTEVGLSQRQGKADGFGLEASREPMLWGKAQDRDLLEFYRELIQERRSRSAP